MFKSYGAFLDESVEILPSIFLDVKGASLDKVTAEAKLMSSHFRLKSGKFEFTDSGSIEGFSVEGITQSGNRILVSQIKNLTLSRWNDTTYCVEVNGRDITAAVRAEFESIIPGSARYRVPSNGDMNLYDTGIYGYMLDKPESFFKSFKLGI